jgi:hypothetical protein
MQVFKFNYSKGNKNRVILIDMNVHSPYFYIIFATFDHLSVFYFLLLTLVSKWEENKENKNNNSQLGTF